MSWLVGLQHQNLEEDVLQTCRRPTLFAIITFMTGLLAGDKKPDDWS